MSDRDVESLRRVVDEVFRDRPRATRRDLYSAAAADIHVPAEALAALNEIPEESYTREEMLAAVDDAVRRTVRDRPEPAGEAPRPPERIAALEDTEEARQAIVDDTTLDALNRGPTGPPPDAPPFREPGE